MSAAPPYARILLKLSGEGFSPAGKSGIAPNRLLTVAKQLKAVVDQGVQVGVVVGGGNLLRGKALRARDSRIERTTADTMGMLGTVMNGLALGDVLESIDCPARVLSAIPMPVVAEPFVRRRAVRHLQKGRVVVLTAGTGHPYLTTDTTAALRAVELDADVLFKATKVDGVYSADPVKNRRAKRYDRLTYQEVLERNLGVMDMAAISLCRENALPILVFNLLKKGTIARAVAGEPVGTLIGGADDAG